MVAYPSNSTTVKIYQLHAVDVDLSHKHDVEKWANSQKNTSSNIPLIKCPKTESMIKGSKI